MIPALAIICCVVAMSIIFTVLLAYACAKASTRPYPTKPKACENKYKDNQ